MDLRSNFFVEDKWMSNFYGQPWFLIAPKSYILSNVDIIQNKNCMYEWRINANKPLVLQNALDLGFDLVETAVEFETEILYKPTTSTVNDLSNIELAKPDDLDGVLNLVDICYINYDKFYNRLKNEKYFSKEKTARYFREGIINSFNNPKSIIIVAKNDDLIVGFYIMKEVESNKYKGISTGVHFSMRGKNLHILMQRKCRDIIKKSYTVINRTQISNYKVLNNHIKEGRKLTFIEHILYLKN